MNRFPVSLAHINHSIYSSKFHVLYNVIEGSVHPCYIHRGFTFTITGRIEHSNILRNSKHAFPIHTFMLFVGVEAKDFFLLW